MFNPVDRQAFFQLAVFHFAAESGAAVFRPV
jgi:hypothetical protein